MPRRYEQLSVEERDRLSLLRGQGKSLRVIAGLIGRDPSTISRELKRNCSPVIDGAYLPHRAQERADRRKVKSHERQRLSDPKLRRYVTQRLRRGWSPERIAGRWRLLGNGTISHEAIYQWIYADAWALHSCLVRSHRKRRRRGFTYRHKTPHIPSRTPITQRPAAVELRQEPGHWEGDTIIGVQGKSVLQVVVERRTRLARLTKMPVKDATCMRKSLTRVLGRYPPWLRKTITYDNGSENAQHLQTNQELGTASYFCAPMHSWEKGSVENVAGLVRRRLPKKTDFSNVSLVQIRKTERWLNSLPRKCLGYQTPKEAFRGVALAC